MKILFISLTLLVSLFSGCGGKASFHGTYFETPIPRPGFTLTGVQGPVQQKEFLDRYTILYFGYTYCPDVCPTTLAYVRDALKALGLQSSQFQVIFVSVDWKRDTPAMADSFAKGFHPNFLGLTGTQEQIDKTVKDYSIYYKINPTDAQGQYTVDHTSTTLVLDHTGGLRLTWSYGTTTQEMTEDLRGILSLKN